MPPSRYGGGSSARLTSAPTVELRTMSRVVVEGLGALCGRVDAVSARILVHHCVPAFIYLGHDQDMVLNFT